MGADRPGLVPTKNHRRAAIAIASVFVAALGMLTAAAPASAHGGSPSNLNHFSTPPTPPHWPRTYWPHVQGAEKTQTQLAFQHMASSKTQRHASPRLAHRSVRTVRYATNQTVRAIVAYFVLYAGR